MRCKESGGDGMWCGGLCGVDLMMTTTTRGWEVSILCYVDNSLEMVN